MYCLRLGKYTVEDNMYSAPAGRERAVWNSSIAVDAGIRLTRRRLPDVCFTPLSSGGPATLRRGPYYAYFAERIGRFAHTINVWNLLAFAWHIGHNFSPFPLSIRLIVPCPRPSPPLDQSFHGPPRFRRFGSRRSTVPLCTGRFNDDDICCDVCVRLCVCAGSDLRQG